ncbi:MAG TPA: DNA adenine methylase [Polyangia bacterium]
MPPPSASPSPFLKWAGGKRQLLPHILRSVPAQVDTYYEPFLGGGAVFFALAGQGRFRRAVLSDANDELINCYDVVRTRVSALVAVLRKHRYEEAYYYRLRDQEPEVLRPVERAARLIYLNRCGYNGLYRVNSAGRFNVPFGRHREPTICDEPRLRAASEALASVQIRSGDFEERLLEASPGDFVYLDPPYVPLSATSSFTSYARGAFGVAEQARLALALRGLGQRGVRALLSNSDCRATRALYRGLALRKVPVRRAINSVPTARGSVAELLVKSYQY